MEFPLTFSMTQLATILGSIVFVVFLAWISRKGKKKARTVPVAAGGWPLIGHILQFRGPQLLLHRTLGVMADKFGPIFKINLGVHPTLVVSNWEIAKDCYTTNDAAFSTRPRSIATQVLTYNYASFGFGPFGPYWRHLRKMTVVNLLSNRRLELLGHIRKAELELSVRDIYDQWQKSKSSGGPNNVKVEMIKWFGDLTMNVIVKIVTGKRYTSGGKDILNFHHALIQVFRYMGMVLVGDALPFLRFLDIGGHEKDMKRTAKEMDSILQMWLDEHKQRRISGETKEDQDFMDMMLTEYEDKSAAEEYTDFDPDTIIKANCLGTLVGGTDTSTVTLAWALSLLLNHPRVLKKAQEEIDLLVGKDRRVEPSDLKNLEYLQAIIKETWRLYPPGPLLAPREAMEDCTVAGYHVPKGTRLMVNAWKIHRDPQIYSDPEEFRPERYLGEHKDVDVKGQNFELIPFGSGRRICTGVSFAWHTVHSLLAAVLHMFDVEYVSNEQVDMTESPGLSNLKANPLEVLLTPRLSNSSLYE